MQIPREERKSRMVKLLFSFFTALLCIVLLGMMGCSNTEDDAPEPAVTPCVYPEVVNTEIRCEQVDQPVCGCDGVTYRNVCEAQYYHGITSWKNGRCDQDPSCFEPVAGADSIECGDLYEPVCGCDGNSYGNICEAEKAGMTEYSEGLCGTFHMIVCAGRDVVLGVESRPGKAYFWTNQSVFAGCATCSKNTLSFTESDVLTLAVFEQEELERGAQARPSNLYTFSIDVRNCMN